MYVYLYTGIVEEKTCPQRLSGATAYAADGPLSQAGAAIRLASSH